MLVFWGERLVRRKWGVLLEVSYKDCGGHLPTTFGGLIIQCRRGVAVSWRRWESNILWEVSF